MKGKANRKIFVYLSFNENNVPFASSCEMVRFSECYHGVQTFPLRYLHTFIYKLHINEDIAMCQVLRALSVAQEQQVHLVAQDFGVHPAIQAELDGLAYLDLPEVRAVQDSLVVRVLSALLDQQVSLFLYYDVINIVIATHHQ